MKKETTYGIIGFLLGIVIVLLSMSLFGNSFSQMGGMMRGQFDTDDTPTTRNSSMMGNIDAHFIEQMIPHHEDAITMANLALTRAQKPEVKQLAENIIASQSKEITQMKKWYSEWFGKTLPTGDEVMNQHGMMGNTSGMHMGMMGNAGDVDTLKNASDFDREFIREMIPHHQMAVMMASMLKNGTSRPEMKKLADDIIAAQTKEIDQMRTWLQEWK